MAPRGYRIRVAAGDQHGTALATSNAIEIVVGSTGRIHGELDDFDHPAVVAIPLVGAPTPIAATIDDDELDFAALPAGPYRVVVRDGDYVDSEVLHVSCGENTHAYFSRFRPRHLHASAIAVRLIEVDTGRPIAGMACETAGTIEHVLRHSVSDSDGGVAISASTGTNIVCWSSRGPALPMTAAINSYPEGTLQAPPPQFAKLLRPGTAQPGFVIEPSSTTIAVVDDGGAAATAGLEVGDTITELDGGSVASLSPPELMYLVWTHPRGTLQLVVDRHGSRHSIAVPIRH